MKGPHFDAGHEKDEISKADFGVGDSVRFVVSHDVLEQLTAQVMQEFLRRGLQRLVCCKE